jgi:hypothetical protein
MEVVINWHLKRAQHARDRMLMRGISFKDFAEAVKKGRKTKQDKFMYESFWRYYSIIYEQRVYPEKGIRKIFPITVKMW